MDDADLPRTGSHPSHRPGWWYGGTAHRTTLTDEERARIVAVANEPRFAETPPARIVPVLADEGVYIASESSFHRVLRAHGQMNRRGRARPPRRSRPPTTHVATRPGDVWCWDVTFHGGGPPASSIGTTMSIGMAALDTSPRRSATPVTIAPCSRPGTNSTNRHGSRTRGGGADRPATGRRSQPSRSIPSGTPSSGQLYHQHSFPVRLARLLSRPDLPGQQPRRATAERGGAQSPGATRSAPWRASMARMASTGPSPT